MKHVDLLLYTGVHTFVLCDGPLSSCSAGLVNPQSSIMEIILICVTLAMKSKLENHNMLQNRNENEFDRNLFETENTSAFVVEDLASDSEKQCKSVILRCHVQ